MNLSTSLMELLAHGEVFEIGRQARRYTLRSLGLLQPDDDEHLQHDYAPEDAPDC